MGSMASRKRRSPSPVLPFTVAPSVASEELVSDAFRQRPTMFTKRVTSCHLRQLFRVAVLRVLLGICLLFGLVGSTWCSPDATTRSLKQWLAMGLGINWGIGIPQFLAVISSGVKVFKHGRSLEVRACPTASPQWMTGLMVTGAALTVWQCLWWARGTHLLLARTMRTNHAFFCFCVLCVTLWPLALIAIRLRERREQGTALKGTAATIVLMGPRTSIPASKLSKPSDSDAIDTDSTDSGSCSTHVTRSISSGDRSERRTSGFSGGCSFQEAGNSLGALSTSAQMAHSTLLSPSRQPVASHPRVSFAE